MLLWLTNERTNEHVARIAATSQGFYDGATQLKRKMWWKNMKLNLIILVVIIIIIIIIVKALGG